MEKKNLPVKMESWIKQTRMKLTDAEEANKADLGGSRDQKIPIQKTQSFKDKKKVQNWFQRQFSRKMSQDYDAIEMEDATAVAAAAFAISSQQEVLEVPQEKKKSEPPKTSFTETKSKMDGTKSPISQPSGSGGSKRFSGSFKHTNDKDNNVPISPVTEEKKPEKTITPAPSRKKTITFRKKLERTDDEEPDIPAPKKTTSFGDKHLMNTDDIKPETPKPKVPPSVHDDDEPHIPAPKKTPSFGDKRLMNTDDIKPETPKPKVPPSVHDDDEPHIPAPKKTPSFGDKRLMNTDDIKPETPKPKVPPLVHDDKEPDIPAPKKTPSFRDKHLMNTDDLKPETPKPKVPPSVHESMSLTPRPLPPPPPPIRETSTPARGPIGTQGQIPSTPSIRETKADAWERNELEKIKERYEKLLETIESWEKRKKMKARRKLNKQELSESEGKRVKARKKYMNKINYIDEIAEGARAQADERRRNEVLKAREKANIIRTTGKLPGLCSCF